MAKVVSRVAWKEVASYKGHEKLSGLINLIITQTQMGRQRHGTICGN
jgi:hypothetical protein